MYIFIDVFFSFLLFILSFPFHFMNLSAALALHARQTASHRQQQAQLNAINTANTLLANQQTKIQINDWMEGMEKAHVDRK